MEESIISRVVPFQEVEGDEDEDDGDGDGAEEDEDDEEEEAEEEDDWSKMSTHLFRWNHIPLMTFIVAETLSLQFSPNIENSFLL